MKGSDTGLTLDCAAAADAANLLGGDSDAVARDKQQERFVTLYRRLSILRTISAQDASFKQVVESGRYLKLAHAICCAEEMLARSVKHFMQSVPDKTASDRLNLSDIDLSTNFSVVLAEQYEARSFVQ